MTGLLHGRLGSLVPEPLFTRYAYSRLFVEAPGRECTYNNCLWFQLLNIFLPGISDNQKSLQFVDGAFQYPSELLYDINLFSVTYLEMCDDIVVQVVDIVVVVDTCKRL